MRKWLTGLLLFSLSLAVAAAERKPNILLVVLDDAGYSDVAGFGRNDAPTPTLAQLGAEGVRFTRHYADSTCRPARLALMTGREAARVAQNPDFRGISPQIVTLPEALQAAGYRTHHIGKWHLGDAVREAWPDRQGFDHWFGFLNQFQLKGPDENGQFTRRPTYLDPFLQSDSTPLQQYRGHLEDILAARVVDTIQQADPSQPWFINYWLFAPHHPSTASDTFLKKFPATPEGKYRALLAQADAEIGKVLQTLRDSGQLDHTLVAVVSDNGGTNQMTNNNQPFAGVKGEFREGSLRTPLIIRWPDQRAAGKTVTDVVAIQDLYPTLLQAAGIPLPKDASALQGQDLHPLLTGHALLPRTLVHEIVSVGLFNYSLLSADGRWRFSPSELYDLNSDPAGTRNLAGQQPTRVAQLEQQYQQWRQDKVRVSLQSQPLSGSGHAVLSGDDFRRAPGYGAWSLAIGTHLPAPDFRNPLYLAWQKGVWSLAYNPDGSFTVQLGSQRLTSKVLSLRDSGQACVPVMLNSWLTRSRLHEGNNTAYLQLYVGDETLLTWQQENPPELATDLSVPTWIGQDEQGRGRWPTSLGPARIYNSALDPDTLPLAQQEACASFGR